MSDIDIQRLRNDPAYWDGVAPEGAEYAAEIRDGVRWYRGVTQGSHPCYEYCSDDVAVWAPGYGKPLHTYFSRPSQPQWRGPEDGLPPVGEPCEVCFNDTVHECRGMFTPAKVIAYHEDMVWLDLGGRQPVRILSECSFRPLKSDKERAVEAAMENWARPAAEGGALALRLQKEFAANLYDAGLLRLPEEQP